MRGLHISLFAIYNDHYTTIILINNCADIDRVIVDGQKGSKIARNIQFV